MVTQEEMRAKLSLDTSALGRAKRDIQEFSEHGHSGFVHAGNGARGFHKLLHKITEESPLLGGALTAALNPVNAAFVLGGIALTYFNKKLDEWNERMDEAQHRNAEAIFGVEAIREATAEVDKMAAEHRKFLDMREDESKRVMDALDLENQKLQDNLALDQERLKLNKQLAEEVVKRQVNTGALSLSAGQAILQQMQKSITAEERKKQLGALGARRAGLETAAGNIVWASGEATEDLAGLESQRESTSKRLANAKALAAKQKKDYEAAQKEADRMNANHGSEAGAWLGDLTEATAHGLSRLTGQDLHTVQERAMQKANDEAAEAKRRLDEYSKNVENIQKQQDELNASYDETKEKVKNWESSLQNVNKQISKTKEEQDKLNKMPVGAGAPMQLGSPIEFGTSELARYNTYYGAIARRIMFGQQLARNAAAAGNDDWARRILSEVTPGGDSPYNLYKLLPGGLTREQNEAKRQKDFIDTILAELNRTGDGVPVRVTSIPNGN